MDIHSERTAMSWFAFERLPYCGAAPAPDDLAGRWNLDPVLLTTLVAVALLYGLGARRANLPQRSRRYAAVGWAIVALALISPLCPVSVALFSARVSQHMILTLVAAPLIALGAPLTAFAALRRPGAAPRPGMPLTAAVVFACLLWLWHAPMPYDATFHSTPLYWAMHLSLIGSAIWLWSALFAADSTRAVSAIGAALIGMTAMSLVGALITFSPRPLYVPHLLTTGLWGLTTLEDQQLGGAIMWVPGGLVFLAAAIAVTSRALAERAPGLFGSRP
jgi:putative membrane protein